MDYEKLSGSIRAVIDRRPGAAAGRLTSAPKNDTMAAFPMSAEARAGAAPKGAHSQRRQQRKEAAPW